MRLKLACCQFAPTWREPQRNMELADLLLKRYTPGDMDVLVLPEMAFTGYCFKSAEDIHPFAEDRTMGKTVQWAAKQAIRLNAFVMVGYPEVVYDGPDEPPVYYNSACLVDRQGNVVTTYQKTFLYEVDEAWAQEGPGFKSMYIEGLGQVGLGICMDLNPYQFKTSFHDYEFAKFHMEQNTELLLCCMAWVGSKSEDEEKHLSTIEYWAIRMSPMLDRKPLTRQGTVFVASNRHGLEEGVTYAGASCVMRLGPPRPVLLDCFDSSDTGVLIVETDVGNEQ
ncbi:hypothetical protein K450DRAFT_220623 [Umbelopsis ramanniana AG]|uniref:CN hydrolase domain-containing protein n=1 Tax=Umbelopsis ramanniana AG TaxID=1314678 RepID=A0AAD5EIY8_UMBRA|nr:uncharacterized protein K450DRAFT_220623 [Umbelopsis ramanniana AG]KAI8583925.1 hypothetical protein K450DRAFT_220623 [Umbelopsis ramanniana AG]